MMYKGYEIYARQIEEFDIDEDGELDRELGLMNIEYFCPEIELKPIFDFDEIKQAIDEVVANG